MNLPHPEDSLPATLLRKAGLPKGQRIVMIEHDGQRYWAKFCEEIKTLRHKILKGNPQRSLNRESTNLAEFSFRGAPVPKVIARSDNCIIMSDHGPDLTQVLRSGDKSAEILFAVGQALAKMHALGLAHGRPCIRDICWDGQHATFLDLEAGAQLDANRRQQAWDLLLLVHSLLTENPSQYCHATLIVEGYATKDQRQVVQKAQQIAKRLLWLELLVTPIVWRHRQRGKTQSEFYAVATTRGLFGAYDNLRGV